MRAFQDFTIQSILAVTSSCHCGIVQNENRPVPALADPYPYCELPHFCTFEIRQSSAPVILTAITRGRYRRAVPVIRQRSTLRRNRGRGTSMGGPAMTCPKYGYATVTPLCPVSKY